MGTFPVFTSSSWIDREPGPLHGEAAPHSEGGPSPLPVLGNWRHLVGPAPCLFLQRPVNFAFERFPQTCLVSERQNVESERTCVSGCGVAPGEVGVPAAAVLFLPPGSQASRVLFQFSRCRPVTGIRNRFRFKLLLTCFACLPYVRILYCRD